MHEGGRTKSSSAKAPALLPFDGAEDLTSLESRKGFLLMLKRGGGLSAKGDVDSVERSLLGSDVGGEVRLRKGLLLENWMGMPFGDGWRSAGRQNRKSQSMLRCKSEAQHASRGKERRCGK